MSRIFLIVILALATLAAAGCSAEPPGLKKGDNGPTKENTQDIIDAAGPVKGLDPNLYYVSKADVNRKVYCGADPMLHKVGSLELRAFQTLREAQHEYPGYDLYRPCSELMK